MPLASGGITKVAVWNDSIYIALYLCLSFFLNASAGVKRKIMEVQCIAGFRGVGGEGREEQPISIIDRAMRLFDIGS